MRISLIIILLIIFNKFSFGQSPNNFFPIIGWNGIPGEFTNLKRFNELKAAGFNVNLSGYKNLTVALNALDVAQKAGIKLILNCPEIFTHPELAIPKLKSHPALFGYYIRDEPSINDFESIKRVISKIRKFDSVTLCYVNLFPNYASTKDLGVNSYDKYLSSFFNNNKLRVYSFDNYPVYLGDVRKKWYENLETFSNYSKENSADFWTFVMSTPYRSLKESIRLKDLKLQVYSNLLYGSQGIQYFTYWTPKSSGVHTFFNGPIDKTGKKTYVYDLVRVMNTELKKVIPYFYNAEIKSIYHTNFEDGTKKYWKNYDTFITLGYGETSKLLINEFYKDGSRYFGILNKDLNSTVSIDIFSKNNTISIIQGGASIVLKKGIKRSLIINSSEMIIVKII